MDALTSLQETSLLDLITRSGGAAGRFVVDTDPEDSLKQFIKGKTTTLRVAALTIERSNEEELKISVDDGPLRSIPGAVISTTLEAIIPFPKEAPPD